MKRLPSFLSAALFAAVSSVAFAQASPATTETNADMAREAQVKGGDATKAEQKAARDKRLSGTIAKPETNTRMVKDAQVKGGDATKAEQKAARDKRLSGTIPQPETNTEIAKDAAKK